MANRENLLPNYQLFYKDVIDLLGKPDMDGSGYRVGYELTWFIHNSLDLIIFFNEADLIYQIRWWKTGRGFTLLEDVFEELPEIWINKILFNLDLFKK